MRFSSEEGKKTHVGNLKLKWNRVRVYLFTCLLVYVSACFPRYGKFVAKYTWLSMEKYNT